MEGGDAANARFDGTELIGVEHRDVGDAVGFGPLEDGAQPRDLNVAGGDDDLPALVDGDVVGVGELTQQGHPATAQRRLEAARFVVETRMDDTGVVSGLVRGRSALLLVEGDIDRVVAQEKLSRDRGTDDARADDGDTSAHGRPPAAARPPSIITVLAPYRRMSTYAMNASQTGLLSRASPL